MMDLHVIEMARLHQAELLREAENERLVREALAARGNHSGISCRCLRWAGRQLVTMGTRLQERHGFAAGNTMITAHASSSGP